MLIFNAYMYMYIYVCKKNSLVLLNITCITIYFFLVLINYESLNKLPSYQYFTG